MKSGESLAYPLLNSPYFFCCSSINAKILVKKFGLMVEKVENLSTWQEAIFSPQQALSFFILNFLLDHGYNLMSLSQNEAFRLTMASELVNKKVAVSLLNIILNSEGKIFPSVGQSLSLHLFHTCCFS
jgi:hypothetical protein